jgi:chromosome segregation ATPase
MPARSIKPSTPTADEVPVNRAMLMGVRSEVLHRIDQGREEARADNQRLEGNIQRLDGKIDAVRAELKADIQRLDGKIDAMRAELKAEIQEVKAELKADIQGVKNDIGEVKTGMHVMQASVLSMQASIERMLALHEEQSTRNKVVLDGHASVNSRLDQLEQRQTQVEETVRYLATTRPAG